MIDVAILVGGKGSRLGKITKYEPKPLLKIGKIRFLDLIISNLLKYNLEKIYLLCAFKKKKFFRLYHKKKIHNSIIYCIDEGEFKGTGGALYKLKKKINKKKFNSKCLVSLISFFVILSPHLIWLFDNNYTTFNYAFKRTGLEEVQFLDHIYNPAIFLGKQIGILIPFFVMFLFIISKLKAKFNFKDRKMLFLLTINIAPIILIFLTSLFMGAKIRTMWMTPFYLFFGVLLVYIFQSQINLKKLKGFVSIFLILFIFSPFAYAYISITQTDKRTDYKGKEKAYMVKLYLNGKGHKKINYIIGNEWLAGNLCYHLKPRPTNGCNIVSWKEDVEIFTEKAIVVFKAQDLK